MLLVFHGSRDADHNEHAARIAQALGLKYAFLYVEPRFTGGPGIPMFISDGDDYRKALELSSIKTPPLIRWPGFVDYLKSLGTGLYIFHGPDRGESNLGLPVAFLEGEPSLGGAPCVETVAPVVLTRGHIYKKIAEKYARCNARLLPPLGEQEAFLQYLKTAIPQVVSSN